MNQAANQFDQYQEQFLAEIKDVSTPNDAQNLKARFIGAKGLLAGMGKSLKDMPPEQRKGFGERLNQLRAFIEAGVQEVLDRLEKQRILEQLDKQWVDLSLRESVLAGGPRIGAYHPNTIIQRQLEETFLSMGFEILDGPHVETEFFNFEALNVPKDHPARDMQDTFWFPNLKNLLRTHTSSVQVHGMLSHKPPFRFIVPGKCFRCERTDASHEMVFHQLEGMMVGKDITVGYLIYFMRTLLREVFQRDVKVRLRPGFFPFVEPGFELDINCLVCSGAGCSVCKHSGWVELLPCGMVHPNVLRYGGIDPEEHTGFAFGLGLSRLVMMAYAIDDIRLLHSADLRFAEQFRTI
jgi:phenylalanyl-tRNA synthetase alpha chain